MAPKAQAFPPEMLEKLGYRTNESGELEETEVAVPPGVTEEAVAQCMAMGFNKAADSLFSSSTVKLLRRQRLWRAKA